MSDTRLIIHSHVREYALVVSKQYRAGKFTRVSQEFIDGVQADVDNLIRQIESKLGEPFYGPVEGPHEALQFVPGFALEAVQFRLNNAIKKIIRNKVRSTPSCGVTL